ncbi:MAG: hemerythrin domain-containing protein [Thauera sp.]|jgi:hemerythrin-like domain-containing protein
MKRHPHLVRLSREHHAALRLGRHLLAGAGAAELRAEHAALAAHFAAEERDLAPLLEARGHSALARRLHAEHGQLRTLFIAAQQGVDEAAAGQALIDHVRFEERELFPVIETLFEELRS